MRAHDGSGERVTDGITPYDLAYSGAWCSECGKPKLNRLWEYPTDCTECTEVITRHRCKRPDLELGRAWQCPDCDSTWTLDEKPAACPDCCGECDHVIIQRRWDYVPGDRIDTAPKHKPQPLAPFRNPFPRP